MDYEKQLKRKIGEMLKEPTGKHYLDSGIAYGRNWQKNQYRDFEIEKECMVFIHADDSGKPEEIIVLYNLYHYLVNHLTIDKNTSYLNRRFRQFSYSEYMKDENWLICMETFLGEELRVGCTIKNTYNYINLLSQVIQYSQFNWGKDSSDYIILQIHNGCDVRGGYTDPYIFMVKDIDDFHQAQFRIEASCRGIKYDPRQTCLKGLDVGSTCNNWWSSFDAGVHFDFHGSLSCPKPIEEYTHYEKDIQMLICKDCGGEVIFTVQ